MDGWNHGSAKSPNLPVRTAVRTSGHRFEPRPALEKYSNSINHGHIHGYTIYMYIFIYHIYICHISSGLRPNPATALLLRILCAIERLKRRSVGDLVVFLFGGSLSVFVGLFDLLLFLSSISALF